MNQPVKTQQPKPRPDEEEEVTGSPNETVRAKTGQPGQLANPVPLNQLPTPNQMVKLNVSHKAA